MNNHECISFMATEYTVKWQPKAIFLINTDQNKRKRIRSVPARMHWEIQPHIMSCLIRKELIANVDQKSSTL